MQIARHFTTSTESPYIAMGWKTIVCSIAKPDGTVVFEANGVTVPDQWSQNAANVLAQKYFRKAGVPAQTTPVVEMDMPDWLQRRIPVKECAIRGETDARQVFDRMTGCWTYWGWKGGYFDSESDASAFRDELRYMLVKQMAAPNSPQWFGTGLHWAYGIDGPAQGHWYYDTAKGEAVQSTSAYERPQPHACFLLSVEDDLVNDGGIMDLWVREARLFKYGSGAGSNFSKLRAAGEPLSGGGKSSGLMSFLKIGDAAAGGIKSGGTVRRAAKMVVVDIDHPDVEQVIDWKAHEERKVAALVAGSRLVPGMEPLTDDWQGEAYQTVSGQNANISIRVTDAFMRAVENDSDWNLTWRTNGKVAKTVKARALWNKIAQAAWQSADPGVQFDTTINQWHTVPNSGRCNTTNPCGEFNHLDDTACNLASLNLLAFLRDDDTFDLEAYVHAVRLWTLVLEISVEMAQFPSKRIAELSHRFRPLGLGYANLGGLLMAQGIPYDSDEGRGWCAGLTAVMTGEAYAMSAEIAARLGPFEGFRENSQEMLNVAGNHAAAAWGLPGRDLSIEPAPLDTHCPEWLLNAARAAWDVAYEGGRRHGYRNAQATCIAPTGTIALVMDCDTTGIEPDFSLVKSKSLAGGGTMTMVNRLVPRALRKLGTTPGLIDLIKAHIAAHGRMPEGGGPTMAKVFQCASGPDALSPEAHLRMMAAAQPFVSGAISKTVNMPSSATVEDCAKTYMKAWTLGLKAIALYRDGSKLSQPLTAGGAKNDDVASAVASTINEQFYTIEHGFQLSRDAAKLADVILVASKTTIPLRTGGLDWHDDGPDASTKPTPQRMKLPSRRTGYTQKVRVGGHTLYLRTGEYPDGQLGEVFIDMHREGAAFRSLLNCLAMSVSIALQYGVPLEEFVEAFASMRFEPAGPVTDHERIKIASSVADFIVRDLAVHYLRRDDLAQVPGHEHTEIGDAPAEREQARSRVIRPGTERDVAWPDKRANGTRPGASVAAMVLGYSGDPCEACGNFTLIRSGTCLRCDTCGTTTGCG